MDRPLRAATCSSAQRPTLTLVYLPHLDYNLQRSGPDHPRIAQDVAAVDRGLRRADRMRRERAGARVIVLSEYGITPVSNPVHINRALREAGCIQRARRARARAARCRRVRRVRRGRSSDRARLRCATRRWFREVKALLEALPGVERVLDEDGKRAVRAGSSALGRAGCDRPAPTAGSLTTTCSTTIARPTSRAPSISIASRATTRSSCSSIRQLPLPQRRASPGALAQKMLGFRYLMDVISLDASAGEGLARPSHRPARGRAAVHQLGARVCWRRARSRRPP